MSPKSHSPGHVLPTFCDVQTTCGPLTLLYMMMAIAASRKDRESTAGISSTDPLCSSQQMFT